MPSDPLRYDLWIEDALRNVVARALRHAATQGLSGQHHFYITFRTGDGGVRMPAYLKALHKDEMTIVLQHQFWDLHVEETRFSVTLSFRGKSERLTIPYTAVSAFADPSVKFGLQFAHEPDAEAEKATPPEKEEAPAADGLWEEIDPTEQAAGEKASEKVIALDAFRKK